MKKCSVIVLWMGLVLGVLISPTTPYAQMNKKSAAEFSSVLSKLKNNPKYQGRVLGTHLRRSNNGYVYEVRIMRPDDSIIVVLVNPETGRVIRDSRQQKGKSNGARKKVQ